IVSSLSGPPPFEDAGGVGHAGATAGIGSCFSAARIAAKASAIAGSAAGAAGGPADGTGAKDAAGAGGTGGSGEAWNVVAGSAGGSDQFSPGGTGGSGDAGAALAPAAADGAAGPLRASSSLTRAITSCGSNGFASTPSHPAAAAFA